MTDLTDLAKNEIVQNMITSPPSSHMKTKYLDSSDSESDEALNQDIHRHRKRMLPSKYLRTSDTDVNIALVSKSLDDLTRIQYPPNTFELKPVLAKNLEFHAEELNKLYMLDYSKTEITSEMFLPTDSQIGKKTQFNKVEGNKSNSLGRESCSKNPNHLWDRQWNRWWGWNWSRKKNVARRYKHSQDGSFTNLNNDPQRLKGGGYHHKVKINPKRLKNNTNYHRQIIVKNLSDPKQSSIKNWDQLKRIYDTPCTSIEAPQRQPLINQETDRTNHCKKLTCPKKTKHVKSNYSSILKQEKNLCQCNRACMCVKKRRPQLKLVDIKNNQCERKFATKPKVFCNHTCKRYIELENCNRNESHSESFVCPKKNKCYHIETVSEYSSTESYIVINAPKTIRRNCTSRYNLCCDNSSKNTKDFCSYPCNLESSNENEDCAMNLNRKNVYCNQKCRFEIPSSHSNSYSSIYDSVSECNLSSVISQKCRCRPQKHVERKCNCKKDNYQKTIPCKQIKCDISSMEPCQPKAAKRKRIVDCDCLVRPIKRSKILDASKKSIWQVLDNNGTKLPIGFIFQKCSHNKEMVDPWIRVKTFKKYIDSRYSKNCNEHCFKNKSIQCQYDIKDCNTNNPLYKLNYTAAYQATSYPFLIGEKTFVCPQSGKVINLKSKFNSYFVEKPYPMFNSIGSLYKTNQIYTNYATSYNNNFTNSLPNNLFSRNNRHNFSCNYFEPNTNEWTTENNKTPYTCTKEADPLRSYTKEKNHPTPIKSNQSTTSFQRLQTKPFPAPRDYTETKVEVPNPGFENQQSNNHAYNTDELNSLLMYTECLLSQSQTIHNNLNNMFNIDLSSINKSNEDLRRASPHLQTFDSYQNINRLDNQVPSARIETINETSNYSNYNFNQETLIKNHSQHGTNSIPTNNEENQKSNSYDLNFIEHNLSSFMNRISDTDMLNQNV